MKAYLHQLRRLNANGTTPLAPGRRDVTAASFLDQIDPTVQASFTPHQQAEIARVIDLAIAKPTPKLVDLRFEIDLLISRFFIVVMVGKDRRRAPRNLAVSRLTQFGNWLAAVFLIIGFNLALSSSVLMFAYLLKSALGINLLPGHFRGFGN
ncbi:hypothetical protein IQ254_29740 [Nodosilinea sp. LEGE 07088]|uniref:hypothetical protein n=1 Tax=Nodosilinea sp. LEGE 07088 TaxID=2777968 RepID=UPI001880BE19|nr:hypothetical protein [Nodosilinea sp. LEGE 07088]MBE9141326.1 hypothetical protein [Nodosilinea sp. LEGE 07088]